MAKPTKIYLVLLITLILSGGFLLTQTAKAELTNCTGDAKGKEAEVNTSWIRLQLAVPGVTSDCIEVSNDNTGVTKTIPVVQDMGAYIAGLYKYLVGVIGILAAVMVFYGGLKWLTAGGNASRVKGAKETVFSALIAIVIAFGSYLLLYTINPKLVQMRPSALKLADTRFQQFDAACLTKKLCFSGSSVGKECKIDTDCPGAGQGACLDMVDITSGTNLTCGTRYNYRKINGQSVSTSDTCIGTFCEVTDHLIGGKSQPVCRSKSDFSKPPTEADHVCVSPVSSCEDTKPGPSSCATASISGEGKCQFVDRAFYNIAQNDSCVWGQILTCDAGYARVGCGACNAMKKSCDPPSSDFLLDKIINSFSSSNRVCDAMSAGETVYGLDRTADGNSLRAVCCQKTVCIGGVNAGQACTDASTCGTGTCGPEALSTDPSNFQCMISDKP